MSYVKSRLVMKLLVAALCVCLYGSSPVAGVYQLCSRVLADNPNAPSGNYLFTVCNTTKSIEVYCLMAFGGYSFLNWETIRNVENYQLQQIISDFTSVLVVVKTQTTPYYGILQNRLQSKLGILVNEYTGYTKPINADSIGAPYIYVGFLSADETNNTDADDFSIISNGRNVTYGNSTTDETLDNYYAFYADYKEATPSPVTPGVDSFTDTAACHALTGSFLPVPSGRGVPEGCYGVMEVNLGGVDGCLFETNAASRARSGIYQGAVGFK